MRFGIVGPGRMWNGAAFMVDWPAAKSVALLRNQYGGHPIHHADEGEERR
jgi:hypothetical protein